MLTSFLRRAGGWFRPGFSFQSRMPLCVPNWSETMAEHQASIWWKVKPYTMTTVERVVALCQSIAHLEREQITGAIVECGVWKGGSMMAAALALQALNSTHRELFLYDTFTGMPEPGLIDVDWQGRSARELMQMPTSEGDLYRATCPLAEVKQAMMLTGYPWEKFHFVAGQIEATVPARAPEKIALLRLDTDWYSSTLHELEHLYPRLAEGGVLIVDDYGHWQGAKRAVDQYFRSAGIDVDLRPIDFTGRLVIKRTGKTALSLAA